MLELNKIYNMDCIEWMKLIPDWSIDCIITDPPYKVITWWKNLWIWKPSWILTENNQLMKNIPYFYEWLPQCYRVLKESSHIYLMTNMLNLKNMMIETEKAWFYIHNILIWKKNNATPNKWYMKNCEYIIFAKKWKSKFINNCGSKVVEMFNNTKNKLHPTEKPIELIEMYVLNSSNIGDIILDPFMWSWTTALACINTNRNYIWFELDEWYYKIANKRIYSITN